MKAHEWIDRVKKHHEITSDYAAAKYLGITKSTISIYRSRGSTLDEKTSISVAESLGIEPAGVILDQMAERVKNKEIRTTLLEQAKGLCILCLIVVRTIKTPRRRKNEDIHLLTTKTQCAYTC